jgi:hypothetical protein
MGLDPQRKVRIREKKELRLKKYLKEARSLRKNNKAGKCTGFIILNDLKNYLES